MDYLLVPTRLVSSVTGCPTYLGVDLLQADHSSVAGTFTSQVEEADPLKKYCCKEVGLVGADG